VAAAGTLEAPTFLRPGSGAPLTGGGSAAGRESSVALIGFEPGILSLASRALIGADLAGADPTGLLLPAPLAGKLGLPGGKPAGGGLAIYTPGGWQPAHLGGLLPGGRASAPVG